jgi:hypothetical protein
VSGSDTLAIACKYVRDVVATVRVDLIDHCAGRRAHKLIACYRSADAHISVGQGKIVRARQRGSVTHGSKINRWTVTRRTTPGGKTPMRLSYLR